LNVYGHLMPDADESARNAINAVLAADASRLWVVDDSKPPAVSVRPS